MNDGLKLLLIAIIASVVGYINYNRNKKAEIKNRNFWPAIIFIGLGAIMFLASLYSLFIETTSTNGKPTNTKQAVSYGDSDLISFMQGKWTADNAGKSLQYKIEVVGNTLKLYEKLDGSEWKSTPTGERPFTLGDITWDYDKYYHVRYLHFDNGDLPLSFRAIGSIWVVCDEKWGPPAILYGGGFTSFHRGW